MSLPVTHVDVPNSCTNAVEVTTDNALSQFDTLRRSFVTLFAKQWRSFPCSPPPNVIRDALPYAITKPLNSMTPSLVARQHTLHQVAQRSPKVLASCQLVLVDKQNVMLEARVQVRL